ncbi:MAG: nicotinamide riboside transporter PnuC [Lachnospiraceae bacterium]|nr:nicotinamide riboside transporter PnuC [Lachnospiraceae bacterium]
MLKKILNYFTKGEAALWLCSVTAIAASFLIFDRTDWLKLAASLIGITALIFNAKGNPAGQILIIVFSVLYGIISYSFAYYGEMITYMGMSAPMAVLAFISWVRNPYNGNRSEVKVNRIKRGEIVFMLILTAPVTVAFYFILDRFGTANLVPSTISVTTSFIAVYLTFRRSEFYALAYAANDLILIVLWVMAAISDISYLSVIICFAMFLINDLYGFISWRKMGKRQADNDAEKALIHK